MRALADTASPQRRTIDASALQAGIAKARTIYPFLSGDSSSMRAFARGLRVDVETISETFTVPSGTTCFSMAALLQIINPIISLTGQVALAGYQFAQSGVRVLIAERFTAVADDLIKEVRDVGPHGMAGLRDYVTAAPSRCLTEKELRNLKGRILFSLRRIAIAIETYAELDDMRPWFAKNRVFDAAFDALFASGGAIVAVAEASGKVVRGAGDLIDKTAKAIDMAIKISVIGAGVWIYLNYFHEERDRER